MGDTKATLGALAPLVKPIADDSFLKEMQSKMADSWKLVEKRGYLGRIIRSSRKWLLGPCPLF